MIHIIRSRASSQQMTDMLEALETYIKLAVDVRRGILPSGVTMHMEILAQRTRERVAQIVNELLGGV